MKITLEALELIDAIEKGGSYAAAAERLHKVPSAVSYMIQKLESDLDITIFDRSGHRAKLSEAGRVLLDYGRQILRDAQDLECRASRVNRGWELELRIALDTIIPFDGIVPFATAFYGEYEATRLQFSHEVLGGTWDALYSRRADLIVGALGDPPFAGYAYRNIGTLDMVLCASPSHPLAHTTKPLSAKEIKRYKAVAIGDTSRVLPVRTIGLMEGQKATVVPSMDAKLKLLCAGLGVGYLPDCVARPYIDKGWLLQLPLQQAAEPRTFRIAWHADATGEALQWWVRHLDRSDLISDLWRTIPMQS